MREERAKHFSKVEALVEDHSRLLAQMLSMFHMSDISQDAQTTQRLRTEELLSQSSWLGRHSLPLKGLGGQCTKHT